MAKLKTPFFIGGVRVTNINELRDNFDPDDILKSFENRKLHRWLGDYGYSSELDQVNELEGLESKEVLSRLASIFNVEVSPQEIEDYFTEVELSETLKVEPTEDPQAEQDRAIVVVEGYYKKYLQLIDQIVQDANSPERLKDDIDILLKNYYRFLDLDFNVFMGLIYQHAPLAMMVLMCHKEWWELCDFFDNHNSRWCQSLCLYQQVEMEQQVAALAQEQVQTTPPPREEPSLKKWFSSISVDSIISNVESISSNVTSYISDNFVSPMKINALSSERERSKQQILQFIDKCRPEWNRVVRKEKTRINMSWIPLVPKGSKCLVLNFNGTFELRAAGAFAGREGVSVKDHYTLSDGLEYKCNGSCVIEYIVL